jgi:hypothetical protein
MIAEWLEPRKSVHWSESDQMSAPLLIGHDDTRVFPLPNWYSSCVASTASY